MQGLILTLALSILPADSAAVDRVDLVEVNHFYDENGKHVFDQLIFRDWAPRQGEFPIRAWRLMKSEAARPVKDWRTGEWVAIFPDGAGLREVRAGAFVERWQQADTEVVEREKLPPDRRRGLLFEKGELQIDPRRAP